MQKGKDEQSMFSNRKYVRVANNKRDNMVVAKDKGNNLEGSNGK